MGFTFDKIGETDHQVIEQRALKLYLKNEEIHKIKARSLNDLCKKPKPNEQYRIVTEKQFNAYAVILAILEDESIEEMSLAIYRINRPTVESIINFIEAGKIKKANFVISSFFNQTKKPEKWAIMLRDFADKNENTRHVYTHNHSKVLAIKTNHGNHYVFEGSGNMSDNARIEQYLYENNEETYNFHVSWMKGLL